jgi:hypothetical protein
MPVPVTAALSRAQPESSRSDDWTVPEAGASIVIIVCDGDTTVLTSPE